MRCTIGNVLSCSWQRPFSVWHNYSDKEARHNEFDIPEKNTTFQAVPEGTTERWSVDVLKIWILIKIPSAFWCHHPKKRLYPTRASQRKMSGTALKNGDQGLKNLLIICGRGSGPKEMVLHRWQGANLALALI